MVFIESIPANLDSYYEGGYNPIPGSLRELRRLAAREKYRITDLMKFKQGGKLLEIGAWIGIFAINAMDAGFAVDVIEMSADAAEFLRDKVGVTVTESNEPVSILKQRPETYDAIVLWHSLEHLPRPWLVIQAVATALKPKGILLIAIPNIDSTQAHVAGNQWLHLDAPRHLYFWDSASLLKLGERAGLRVEHVTTRDKLSRVIEKAGWQTFLHRFIRVPLLRQLVGKLFAGGLTNLSLAFGRTDGGAGITAVFIKP